MNCPSVTSQTSPARRVAGHPQWCAHTHACGLGEHRATPITLTVPGRGVIVLTRVLAANGRQHVEIRTRIVLAGGDRNARAHLARILTELDTHLRRVIYPSHP